MNKCKKCLHFSVCEKCDYDEDREGCMDFINDFPCVVGQTVYCKDGAWNVVGFDCNRVNRWSVKLERWKDRFRDFHERKKVAFSSFGKRVFLTQQEAEKVFERENEK